VQIFDLVERAGIDGIHVRELVGLVWPDKSESYYNLRNQISEINSRLCETDYEIRGNREPRGYYRLVRRFMR
jgi:DNA-binding winged helix-turn-helix (wHTH) protein